MARRIARQVAHRNRLLGAVLAVPLLAVTAAWSARGAPGPSPRDVSSVAWTSPGYWLAGANGGVTTQGAAPFYGSAAGLRLSRPVVGMTATPTGRGYWLVATDGGIFSFGDAAFLGSTGGIRLNQPIVGMAATPTGRGYWLVASDGGIFTFGDAAFFGSTGSLHLVRPIVAMAPTPSGQGYWLVAGDGGIFTFGDARFLGSPAASRPPPAVTAMTPTPSGHGYWLAGADGRVFAFGDAPNHGSAAGLALAAPVTGIAATPDAGGYLLAGADGGVFGFGNDPYRGGARGHTVAVVSVPPRPPARTVAFYYPWYASLAVDGEWRHWDEGGHSPPLDIGSDYYPGRGAYSSSDPSVVDAQMADLAGAGVDEAVVSWWGRGSFEDQKLPLVEQLAAAHGVQVGVQIEPYDGRSADSVAQDIAYLEASYGASDFWVYRAQDFTASDWAPALAGVTGARVWAESFWDVLERGGVQQFVAAAGFSGVYTYDPFDVTGPAMAQICGSARELHLLCSPSVAPGFTAVRATGQGAVRPRANGATYDSTWQGALDSDADVVSITSYNEWHEGSQIEPAVDFCPPGSGFCYQSYDGAYGQSGASASTAYLARTAQWVARYRAREAP
ncbi:MAG TPA: hypothetical protein VFW24_00865 [Acidimicrobiales bacterium]|nr:hypothetical protein [Acidimicrobiales bacterium]